MAKVKRSDIPLVLGPQVMVATAGEPLAVEFVKASGQLRKMFCRLDLSMVKDRERLRDDGAVGLVDKMETLGYVSVTEVVAGKDTQVRRFRLDSVVGWGFMGERFEVVNDG